MKAKLRILVPFAALVLLMINQAPAQTTKPVNSRQSAKFKKVRAKTGNKSAPDKTSFSPTPALQPSPSTEEIPVISLLFVLISFLIYFSPTIVAWIKKRKNPVYGSTLFFYVAMINIFFGWFCFGWVVAWVIVLTNLFGRLSSGWDISSLSFGSGGTPTNYLPPVDSTDLFSSPEPPVCSVCHGSGQKPCTSSPCWGKGSWYEQGDRFWCSFCSGSGKVQCLH